MGIHLIKTDLFQISTKKQTTKEFEQKNVSIGETIIQKHFNATKDINELIKIQFMLTNISSDFIQV